FHRQIVPQLRLQQLLDRPYHLQLLTHHLDHAKCRSTNFLFPIIRLVDTFLQTFLPSTHQLYYVEIVFYSKLSSLLTIKFTNIYNGFLYSQFNIKRRSSTKIIVLDSSKKELAK